jgi:hypothetical protein
MALLLLFGAPCPSSEVCDLVRAMSGLMNCEVGKHGGRGHQMLESDSLLGRQLNKHTQDGRLLQRKSEA